MTSPAGARLGTDAIVALGELSEQRTAKVHRPDAVATLFEPDVLVLKGSAQEKLPTPEANGSAGAYQAHQVMARVLRRGQHARILAARRSPPAGGRLLAQGIVRGMVGVGVGRR